MQIYLQSQVNESGIIRFIHLILQEDLVSGWTLIRESGKQGSSGTVKREHFDNREMAIDAMIRSRDKNISRGYHIAFVQGDSLTT